MAYICTCFYMYNIHYSHYSGEEESSQEMWQMYFILGEGNYCKGGEQEACPLTPQIGILLIVYDYRKSAGSQQEVSSLTIG
jgi:hypothetical protein